MLEGNKKDTKRQNSKRVVARIIPLIVAVVILLTVVSAALVLFTKPKSYGCAEVSKETAKYIDEANRRGALAEHKKTVGVCKVSKSDMKDLRYEDKKRLIQLNVLLARESINQNNESHAKIYAQNSYDLYMSMSGDEKINSSLASYVASVSGILVEDEEDNVQE